MIKSPDFIRNRTYLTPFIAIHIPMGEPPALPQKQIKRKSKIYLTFVIKRIYYNHWAGRKTQVQPDAAGRLTRHFFCPEFVTVGILSIFVDESGDFGTYSQHSPYYIVTMVFHNQESKITEQIQKLDQEILSLGYEKDFVIHTAPLIRKEEMFSSVSPNERRALFTKLFYFVIKSDIHYKTFIFEKRQFKRDVGYSLRKASSMRPFSVPWKRRSRERSRKRSWKGILSKRHLAELVSSLPYFSLLGLAWKVANLYVSLGTCILSYQIPFFHGKTGQARSKNEWWCKNDEVANDDSFTGQKECVIRLYLNGYLIEKS